MAQAKFQISLEVRQLDGEEVLRDPITITQTVDVDMHKGGVHYNVPAASAAFGLKNIKETNGIQAPSMLLVYSPDGAVRILANPNADLTGDAAFNTPTLASPGAPLAHLALFVNLDGSDMGLDTLDLSNPHATLVRKVLVMASGEDA